MDYAKILSAIKEKYSKKTEEVFKYGTAGFRNKSDKLDFLMFRMGILAALRSSDKKAAIGVMITASHNPVRDNGIKLVDPLGEMLAVGWEGHATDLVNAADEDVQKVAEDILTRYSIDVQCKPVVFVGRDTRPSSDRLLEAVVLGAESSGAEIRDIGVVSTPILHFVLASHNTNGRYGVPSEGGYYAKLSSAFNNLKKNSKNELGNYKSNLYFDGANGVGAIIMKKFLPFLENNLDIHFYNEGDGVLNSMCGADFVKTNQTWPSGVPKTPDVRCVSFDGDADRIIYSYVDEEESFHLLDGDKICALVALYFKKLLNEEGVDLNLGIVQTAYANGASTEYIAEQLNLPIVFAKTGVKFLHHEAAQFDIGIYFEANGHGTVIFSEGAKEVIETKSKELKSVMSLINETVGDALSDMLLVEIILTSFGWSVKDWDNIYTDFPNKLSKISVADRSVIKTTDAERKCVTPKGFQEKIDEIVNRYENGRSFVRPSGTEDVVRVFAEAKNEEDVRKIASEVCCLTYEMAGGVGEKPKKC